MSGTVDVLAIMDRLNEIAYSEWTGPNGDLTHDGLIAKGEEARAAVAELIEAVAEYRRSASTTNRIDVLRLDAALARVRGAA